MAYHNRGFVWHRKQDYDKALADYDAAIRLDPKYAVAYANRGAAYKEKGDLDRAIADYDAAIRLDPKLAVAYNNRGFAYDKKGDLDRVIADYDAAIRLDPKYAVAYANRGAAYEEKGDLDRAIADYDAAIRLDPKLAVAYHNRGFVWHRKQDYDKALADYDAAIRLDPKHPMPYANRGAAYDDKGDLDRAIADYEEAIRLNPELTLIRDTQGRLKNIHAKLAAAYKKKGRPSAEVSNKANDGKPAKTAISDFGLEVQPLSAQLAEQFDLPAGVTRSLLVRNVKEGSPADAAGIKEGDLITKVIRDRKIQPLSTVKEFQDLTSKTDELSFYVQSGKNAGRFVTLAKAKRSPKDLEDLEEMLKRFFGPDGATGKGGTERLP